MASNQPGWSDEQTAILKRRWCEDAASAATIAKELGVTRNAVIGRAGRLKLKQAKREDGLYSLQQSGEHKPHKPAPPPVVPIRRSGLIEDVVTGLLREPTKAELRMMLQQALFNTAMMQTTERDDA